MVWKTLQSEMKADFPLFKVFEDNVRLPNNLELNYYWVEKLPVVAILPVISGKIVMVRQYRYPVGSYSLEIPAGHIARGETPRDCAIRELREETGYVTDRMEKLMSYNPSTEYSDQRYDLFIASELVEGEADREEYEIIEVEILDVESVIENILNGAITDGRTITTVLLARHLGLI